MLPLMVGHRTLCPVRSEVRPASSMNEAYLHKTHDTDGKDS